jgi:hypothetical protein
MKKIVITIFSLPNDLDYLELLLIQLNKCSNYIDTNNFSLYVSLSTDDFLIDWDNSTKDKETIEKSFFNLKNIVGWNDTTFQIKSNILGALSNKINAYNDNLDATHFLWLDPDICFDDKLLINIIESIDKIQDKKYIITPEFVKLWDKTFDCLVNEKYMYESSKYCFNNNPFKDSGQKGEVYLEEVINDIDELPNTKFGAGWATCITKSLLDVIPIPESMGHYGPDDTYIMYQIDNYNKISNEIKQYKMVNYIVCENHQKKDIDTFLVKSKNKKDYFKNIAEKEMNRILGTNDIF